MESKRAMIIAPHPDDEINLAGQILPYLQQDGYEIYIVYTTNGDSDKKIGNKRLSEALKSCEILGIPSNNVVFLGYANEWKDGKHLYNVSGILQSATGKYQTNSIEGFPEYCYKKYNIHKDFTQSNFKDDLKDVICDYLPELIICVDIDSHADHRAASLSFEEVIGYILKEKKEYRPRVLKKFAYNGVWKGEKDYYPYPCACTQMKRDFNYSGEMHDLESPTYLWKDKIRYISSKQTITPLLSQNVLYKSAKMHKCTVAWYEMQRVINGDSIYWERRTDNLLFENIKIRSSSGDTRFINDFKTFDVDNICDKELKCSNKEYCWRPDVGDSLKQIKIEFDNPVKIQQINIYEDFSKQNHIKQLQIEIAGNMFDIEPNENGSMTVIYFEKTILAKELSLRIINWYGKPGIGEIELYSQKLKELAIYDSEKLENSVKDAGIKCFFFQEIEKIWFKVRFLFAFKIGYEFHRLRGVLKK